MLKPDSNYTAFLSSLTELAEAQVKTWTEGEFTMAHPTWKVESWPPTELPALDRTALADSYIEELEETKLTLRHAHGVFLQHDLMAQAEKAHRERHTPRVARLCRGTSRSHGHSQERGWHNYALTTAVNLQEEQ